MAMTHEEAVEALYRAPHEAFVSERKRLAAVLRAAGDRPGAARLVKLSRPPLSAWAVNQLWWREREAFERLLAAGARLRAGDLGATGERRDALAALKASAASLLAVDGHAVSEGTLRRVTTTLSALAASGGFDPERPGALSADRDPPGFDMALLPGALAAAPPESQAVPADSPVREGPSTGASAPDARAHAPTRDTAGPPAPRTEHAPERPLSGAPPVAAREQAAREQAAREQAAREQAAREQAAREQAAREQAAREEAARRRERERAERRAERQRLDAALPTLRADLERRRREVERLRAEVTRAEGLAEQARLALEEAEARRSALGSEA